jgi:phosphoribosylglycinamide formyltransferase-1
VLISGTGSNLQALLDASSREGYAIAGVISNRPEAPGLARAKAAGLPAVAIDHASFPDRPAFETALDAALDRFAPDLIALAGFMRVLTADFVARHEGRLLNVHPSLLPAYRGLHTHARALAAGECWHGTSIHYVTAELDGGPVVLQGRLAVRAGESEEQLRGRVQALEHRLYPQVLGWIAAGRLQWRESAPWFDGISLRQPRVVEETEACPS